MLTFDHIVNSSELASTDMTKLDDIEKNAKCRFTLASSITKDFLESVFAETMTGTEPQNLYQFDIEIGFNLAELRNTLDDIMYRIFKSNMFAMPQIMYKEPTERDESRRIFIHAASTIKSILNTDKRLECEMEDVLRHHGDALQEGNPVLYTNFNHVVGTMPEMYSKTRVEYIRDLLKDKGYITEYDPTSMVFSISASSIGD